MNRFKVQEIRIENELKILISILLLKNSIKESALTKSE
jgi:hypothetical protein